MVSTAPRPLWGWTPSAQAWLAVFGAIAAVGLIIAPGTPDGSAAPVPRLIVDPNTAPPEVLVALPKLGPALVGRIVAARAVAPFQSLDDLDARVRGIGPATIASLRPYLHIEPSRADVAATRAVAVPAPRGVRIARLP